VILEYNKLYENSLGEKNRSNKLVSKIGPEYEPGYYSTIEIHAAPHIDRNKFYSNIVKPTKFRLQMRENEIYNNLGNALNISSNLFESLICFENGYSNSLFIFYNTIPDVLILTRTNVTLRNNKIYNNKEILPNAHAELYSGYFSGNDQLISQINSPLYDRSYIYEKVPHDVTRDLATIQKCTIMGLDSTENEWVDYYICNIDSKSCICGVITRQIGFRIFGNEIIHKSSQVGIGVNEFVLDEELQRFWSRYENFEKCFCGAPVLILYRKDLKKLQPPENWRLVNICKNGHLTECTILENETKQYYPLEVLKVDNIEEKTVNIPLNK